MIKSILTTLALSMVLFSLSCFTINNKLGEYEFELQNIEETDETGSGTSRKITATVSASIGSGSINPTEYSYTLYYINASEAYPSTQQNIDSLLSVVPENLADLKTITGSNSTGGQLVDSKITFAIDNLDVRTLYLFFIESSHPSEDTINSSITSTRGWFKTDIMSSNNELTVQSVSTSGSGTSKTITATTPSTTAFATMDPAEYSYTLYYVDSSLAYSITTITDLVRLTPLDGMDITSKNSVQNTNSQTAVPGASITFNLSSLPGGSIYLFTIETKHNSNTDKKFYTSITSTPVQGYFQTTASVFTLQSTSDGVSDGASLPAKYYGTESLSAGFAQQSGAANTSPQLSWSNAPAGTNGYLIVMYDTFQGAMNWLHWVRKEDASVSSVTEGVGTTPDTNKQYSTNSSAQARYAGPQPPSGTGTHNYVFQIFALDTAITNESITTGTTQTETSALRSSLNKNVGDTLVGSIQILGVASFSVDAEYRP